MKKKDWIIALSVWLLVVVGCFAFWNCLPFNHWCYWALRETGIRKKAQVTYEKDGTITIDKIDPGERVEVEMHILFNAGTQCHSTSRWRKK